MTDYSDNTYKAFFDAQKEHQFMVAKETAKQRIRKLKRLQIALTKTYKSEIRQALAKDFKKPRVETDLTEIYLVVAEIKHAKRNLHRWIRKQHVETPLALLGTSSYYYYEPKGVCLIISPWNYPVNLTFSPLVAAIAAGNTAIIKPSEITPHTSEVLARIVEDLFEEQEVALIQGDAKSSQELLKLPFNHIFFTGSPAIGKVVMEAASKNLTSVTLELGGKSPTIIDRSADLKSAAKTIIWTKFLNNGQTCIAPDYILIEKSVKPEFLSHCETYIKKYYGHDPELSENYSRVVSDKHFSRLKDHLKDAKNKNATFDIGGDAFAEERYIEPTLISDLPENAELLNEEIFGPILPIITYQSIEEAIDYINSKERPLALYVYSKSKTTINQILENTRAGSSAINNATLQFTNHNMPFGGVNNSGIGKSHGFFGFEEFSNRRSITSKNFPGPISLLKPPYTKFVQRLVDLTIKWF